MRSVIRSSLLFTSLQPAGTMKFALPIVICASVVDCIGYSLVNGDAELPQG